MATIYRAHCDWCDYTSEIFPEAYGAVFVDKPRSTDKPQPVVAGMVCGESASMEDVATQLDPRLVVLAHPAESSILASTGYTWTDVAIEGRYVQIKRVICSACGTLFDVRRLACPRAFGCQMALVIGIVAGVAIGLWQKNLWIGFFAAYGAASALVILAGWIVQAYTRIRFRVRARELEGQRSCPRCKSTKYVSPRAFGVFPCPRCSQQSMRVKFAGRS